MRKILPGILRSDSGQSSIDFIFGFGVFLVTFIFAISFVAGIFTPFQPGAIDLSSVAYRTSAILVEDPGWYIYNGTNGHLIGDSAWETVPVTTLESEPSLRIGLADDKSDPNVLSIDKINAFNNLIGADYPLARNSMGLSSSNIIYDIQVNLTVYNPLNQTTSTLIATTCNNSTNGEVENITRNVMVDYGKYFFVDAGVVDPYSSSSPDLMVNIQNLTTRDNNLYIMFYYNVTSDVPANINSVNAFIGNSSIPLIIDDPDGYSAMLNGNPIHSSPFTVNKGDVIQIIIYSGAIADNSISSIDIDASKSIFPTSNVNYVNDPVYQMKSICYPGTLKLEVWSYELS
jgi:hypothetical protein